jgi:hypothetical protein
MGMNVEAIALVKEKDVLEVPCLTVIKTDPPLCLGSKVLQFPYLSGEWKDPSVPIMYLY